MRPERPIPPMHSLVISVVCFVLFLICLGFLLAGCASSRLGKGLDVAVVAASTADYVTTQQAIASGRGTEANPVLGQGALRQAVIKFAGTTGVMLLTDMWEQNGHAVTAHVIRVALSALWAGVAIHNAGVGR